MSNYMAIKGGLTGLQETNLMGPHLPTTPPTPPRSSASSVAMGTTALSIHFLFPPAPPRAAMLDFHECSTSGGGGSGRKINE